MVKSIRAKLPCGGAGTIGEAAKGVRNEEVKEIFVRSKVVIRVYIKEQM